MDPRRRWTKLWLVEAAPAAAGDGEEWGSDGSNDSASKLSKLPL